MLIFEDDEDREDTLRMFAERAAQAIAVVAEAFDDMSRALAEAAEVLEVMRPALDECERLLLEATFVDEVRRLEGRARYRRRFERRGRAIARR